MGERHRHVVLVGLMGSGKTTVGKLLAERLGRPLVDTDDEIEAATGMTVREIWRRDGEPAFRKLETAVVREALASSQANIVAAAGGVVLSPANRELLGAADSTVVWLTADPETLASRTSGGGHRPLLDDDPLGALRRMAAERADLYREVADVEVDVATRQPDEIADQIAAVVLDGDADHG